MTTLTEDSLASVCARYDAVIAKDKTEYVKGMGLPAKYKPDGIALLLRLNGYHENRLLPVHDLSVLFDNSFLKRLLRGIKKLKQSSGFRSLEHGQSYCCDFLGVTQTAVLQGREVLGVMRDVFDGKADLLKNPRGLAASQSPCLMPSSLCPFTQRRLLTGTSSGWLSGGHHGGVGSGFYHRATAKRASRRARLVMRAARKAGAGRPVCKGRFASASATVHAGISTHRQLLSSSLTWKEQNRRLNLLYIFSGEALITSLGISIAVFLRPRRDFRATISYQQYLARLCQTTLERSQHHDDARRLIWRSSALRKEKEYTMKYHCTICGHIYDPALGDPENDIAPGTAFADLPDDWICPQCGVGKDFYEQD